VNWIFQSRERTHDVVLLGSSLTKEGVDPGLLSKLIDCRVTQLAWGGRGLTEQALYLELFLEHHHCKTLVLELHPNGLKQGAFSHPLDDFRYIPRIANPTINRHVKEHAGRLQVAAWRFIPMWAMAQFSSQIGWHDVLACRRQEAFDPNTPPSNQHVAGEAEMRAARREDSQWRSTQEAPQFTLALMRILELCEQKGVQVHALYPPMFDGHVENDTHSLERYRQLLGSTPILVAGRDYEKDAEFFQDAHHLNVAGSHRLTAEIAALMDTKDPQNATTQNESQPTRSTTILPLRSSEQTDHSK
jgi:hypothetical protein